MPGYSVSPPNGRVRHPTVHGSKLPTSQKSPYLNRDFSTTSAASNRNCKLLKILNCIQNTFRMAWELLDAASKKSLSGSTLKKTKPPRIYNFEFIIFLYCLVIWLTPRRPPTDAHVRQRTPDRQPTPASGNRRQTVNARLRRATHQTRQRTPPSVAGSIRQRI